MEKMSYKTFVWPRNPHTYRENWVREPHFKTVDGKPCFDKIGDAQCTITGAGTFYGSSAFSDFQRLAEVFEDQEPGNLEHPLWGIRYCYFTGLELIQEPKDNCVSYRFTFTLAKTNGQIPQ